jgi:hypothetical protein
MSLLDFNIDRDNFDETYCSLEKAKWFLKMSDSNGNFLMCFHDFNSLFEYVINGEGCKIEEWCENLYVRAKDDDTDCKCRLFDGDDKYINTIEKLREHIRDGKSVTLFQDDRNPMTYTASNVLYFVNKSPHGDDSSWVADINMSDLHTELEDDLSLLETGEVIEPGDEGCCVEVLVKVYMPNVKK